VGSFGQCVLLGPVNANWTGGSDGLVDNAAGTLTGLTRTDATPSQGDDEWVLFARVCLSGNAPVNKVTHTFGPYDAGVGVTQAAFTVGSSTRDASVVADLAKVYAVVYDVNDDGRINSGDFSYFSAAYGGAVGSSEDPAGPFYAWADFDGSGRVLSGDLSWLSTVYRKNTSDIDFYDLPNRYRPAGGPTGPRPSDDMLCYSVRVAMADEGASALKAAGQAPASPSSTVLASGARTATGAADVAALSAGALLSNAGTRAREAAVDELFGCPVPTTATLAQGKQESTRASAGRVQQAALCDVVAAKTLEGLVGNTSRPTPKTAASPFDDGSNLTSSSVGLDHVLVDTLVKAQLKRS
jgi:hypothetical protein